MNKIRTILVATDFTPPADAALDFAVDLARDLGASVALVHAHEIPVYGFPDAAFVVSPGSSQQLLEQATAALDATAARFAGKGVKVETFLREGRPWDVVNEVVTAVGADLVVVGTHGRRGLAHALLGSVAEHMVRVASVPVLTVRAPATVTRVPRSLQPAAVAGEGHDGAATAAAEPKS